MIVVDNNDGTLTATADSTENEPLTFTNKYSVEPVTADIEVTKALAGAAWPEDKTLTLTISGDDPMPETTEASLTSASSAKFGPITYTVPDTYKYTVTEDGFGTGWSGSGNVTATVEVTDNGNGPLATKVTYSPESATITNTYKAEGSIVLEANKELTGRDWQEGESFTFALIGPDGTKLQEKPVTANGPVTFDAVSYTQADAGKTYEYTITETTNPMPANVVKSGDITATVTVTDNGNGTLKTDVSYSPKNATVVNTYTPTPVKAAITVNKTIDDYIAGSDKTFEFTMTPVDGAPMPEGKDSITAEITTTDGTGTVTLDDITYTKKGEYKYKVVETADQAAGWTYDTKTYEVTVKVTDDPTTGKLSAEVVYGEGATAVDVHNLFQETATSVTLHVDKIIEDQSNSAQDGTFTFQLKNEAGEVIQTKKIATQNFKGSVDFDGIKFTKSGTYKYSIQETGTDGNGWDYDTKECPVVITVSDNFETAILKSETTIDGESTTKVTITNVYKAEPVTLSTIEVTKSIEDTSGSAPETTFEFTLETTDDSPMPEAGGEKRSVTGEGTSTFGEIKYEKAGTYNYTITEVNGGETGYTYDTAVYSVTVEVVDEGGKLVATPTITVNGEVAESLSFNNPYKPLATSAPIRAKKALEGRSLKAGEFTFELSDAEGNVVKTAKNAADGSIDFGTIAFDEVGTYTFTAVEVEGSDSHITYDTSVKTFTVEVVDVDGQLEATVTCDDETATFENVYTPDQPKKGKKKVPPVVRKLLLPTTGDPLAAGSVMALSAIGAAALLTGLNRRRKRK